jgi:hypothetical protein
LLLGFLFQRRYANALLHPTYGKRLANCWTPQFTRPARQRQG